MIFIAEELCSTSFECCIDFWGALISQTNHAKVKPWTLATPTNKQNPPPPPPPPHERTCRLYTRLKTCVPPRRVRLQKENNGRTRWVFIVYVFFALPCFYVILCIFFGTCMPFCHSLVTRVIVVIIILPLSGLWVIQIIYVWDEQACDSRAQIKKQATNCERAFHYELYTQFIVLFYNILCI